MTQASPLESIFFAVLEKPSPAERRAFLDEVCAGDDPLRQQVERMLAARVQAGSFLEQPICAIATTDMPGPTLIGVQIGPYKLREQIGEGGMGVVFVAEQTEPVKRKVALKLIKPGMDSRQVVARFEAERQALAMMDHPNIAKVFDGGTSDAGQPYFVMELVQGLTITDYCDEHGLSTRERLQLFLQVCRAVQHAHLKGIIHRDLKPSNVLVPEIDGTAVPKVIDFGVAKAVNQGLTEQTLYTQFSQMVGTPLYMSPEQSGLGVIDVDTRSDIYSLGVLLYELLTGATPFDGESLKLAGFDEMRRIIREDDPPRPSVMVSTLDAQALSTVAHRRGSDPRKLSATLAGELDWIVMKCLEKERVRRYQKANDLACDVTRYLSDEPVGACPPSVSYRLRKFLRRNRVVITTGVLVLTALIGGMLIRTWQTYRGASQFALAMPEPPALDVGEALLLAENGQWHTAMLTFEQLAKDNPNDYVAHLRYATLQLYLGNQPVYRDVCRDLVNRFAETSRAETAERISRVCALAPQSVDDLAAVTILVDRAQLSPASTSGFQDWYRLAKGLVEYRAGRPESAIEWLNSCNPMTDRLEYGNDIARDAIVYAALGLAHHDVGHTEQAYESLAKSIALVESRMPNFATDPDSGAPLQIGPREDWIWYDWLHCLILLREAEQYLATLSNANSEANQQ